MSLEFNKKVLSKEEALEYKVEHLLKEKSELEKKLKQMQDQNAELHKKANQRKVVENICNAYNSSSRYEQMRRRKDAKQARKQGNSNEQADNSHVDTSNKFCKS